MTTPANQLDMTASALDKLSVEAKSLLDRQAKALRDEATGELAKVNKRLDEIGSTMTALQQSEAALKQIVADMETKARPAGTSDLAVFKASVASRIVRSAAWAQGVRNMKRGPATGSFSVDMKGSLWGGVRKAEAGLLDRIADAAAQGKSVDFDATNAGTAVTPQYIPGVIEMPRLMPIIRQLVPVLATAETNLIRMDRQKRSRNNVAVVTATTNSGNTAIPVDNVSGFSSASGWNTVYLDNGSDPIATHTVSAVSDPDPLTGAGTITLTAATTINLAKGDKLYAQAVGVTPEGELAPRAMEEMEDYEVPVCELSNYLTANAAKLDDVVWAEAFIERQLMARLAEREDAHCFYGPGGSGKITGIFADTAVAESTRSGGTTHIDHIIDGIYEVWGRYYTPDVAVVSLAIHKALTKSKDSTGRYLFLPSAADGTPPRLHIVALRGHSGLNTTDGVVGDWQMACTLFDREMATIEVGYNGNDLTRRKKTAIAFERIAFAIEQPGALQRLVF